MQSDDGNLKIEPLTLCEGELVQERTKLLPLTIYSEEEKLKAVEAIKMLLKWRDEDREKGLIDW